MSAKSTTFTVGTRGRGTTEVTRQVQDAVAFADSSPMPEPSTLLEDVYA